MILTGKSEDSEAGVLFQTDVIGWASLWEYLNACQSDVLQNLACRQDRRDDGMDVGDCITLADALDAALEVHGPERFYENATPISGWAHWDAPKKLQDRIMTVTRFAEFLRHCGGYVEFDDQDYLFDYPW